MKNGTRYEVRHFRGALKKGDVKVIAKEALSA
jgi:hypothetical protein